MKSEPELESAKHMTQTSTIFFKFCFYRSNIGKNENDPTSVGLGPRATISVPFLIPLRSLSTVGRQAVDLPCARAVHPVDSRQRAQRSHF